MRFSSTLSTILLLAACETAAPPADLLSARNAYARALHGIVEHQDPVDLNAARKSLAAAERSFANQGDTALTRDLAYIAQRQAQTAAARADVLNEPKAAASAPPLDAPRVANEYGDRVGVSVDADMLAAQTAADLAGFASVKREPRGIVISMPGSVLFVSSKSDLLLEAEVKLNGIADKLSEQAPNANFVIEGHTDSQGAIKYNQELSERRARTVRDYLVSRGIPAERVTSKGFGAARAIADNESPEGRAHNRRVEIVVEPVLARAD